MAGMWTPPRLASPISSRSFFFFPPSSLWLFLVWGLVVDCGFCESQNGLAALDPSALAEALKLFRETKPLLQTSASLIGTGTVGLSVILWRSKEILAGDCRCSFELKKTVFFFCQPEEAERCWFAFVLYSAKRLGSSGEESKVQEGSEDGGISLCKILRAAKLKWVKCWCDFGVWFVGFRV